MKKIPFIILMFLMIVSCGPDIVMDKQGENVLDREKFTELMVDVQVLEAAYSIHFQRADTSRKQMAAYYAQVLELHNVTQEQFKSSIQWYALHPELMEEIYSDVGERLSRKKADLEH